MNSRPKLFMLMVCTVCFATIWRLSSHLFFEAVEEIEELEIMKEINKTVKLEMTEAVKPCSCNTCLSQQRQWFMEHYRKTVNPFLTSQENMTQEVFSWWKALQREHGSLNKFKAAKESLFKMFPSKPDLIEPSPDGCCTCAVVGNSGNLRGSLYGKQIDAHDLVIRMNSAKTVGYKKDVGTKTTHHVMYPESAINLDNNTHLVLFPFKILDLQWLMEAFTTGFRGRSYAPVIMKIKANKNLVMVVNPAFMKYVHESWLNKKGRYPSTGFMTLVLAMHICDEVKVFGFGADKDGNWNHYWEELRNKHLKTGQHPGLYEYNLIQALAKQNKVTFYKGC